MRLNRVSYSDPLHSFEEDFHRRAPLPLLAEGFNSSSFSSSHHSVEAYGSIPLTPTTPVPVTMTTPTFTFSIPSQNLGRPVSVLQGDAAKWAESNPEAVRLLDTDEPTQATVEQFTSLFKQRFPAEVIEVVPVTFDAELADIRQQSTETITAYYTKTLNLMHKYGAKDRGHSMLLSLAEGSLLDTFLRTWIRGLTDQVITRKCAENMGSPDRSLRLLYDVAESTRRVNIEIQKLFEDEAKENELQFYKDLAQRNMPATQIDALHASYHVKAQGPG
ncbi:hypothetical protein HO173_003279 [Letharia columbiana]|uniref:Retrotransposon gag domain-containing protein n=1 Tax=Letharia columbiana TaxID=112416 RepID=A0A8H6G1L6_9LECA|nr:uncharacterized protein HO173_003279 [Letharia columbiana]KAF6238772.1 hypothetical protein HO173_003279 [Letharia columbiana]